MTAQVALTNHVIQGHVLDVLQSFPDGSVNCCVTSPPYWGLRDYGLEPQIWDAKEGCEHEWADEQIEQAANSSSGVGKQSSNQGTIGSDGERKVSQGQFCVHCNAWKGSLGLEPTPELYVQHLVQVFREIKRVLRKDGTVWLNLGDNYATHQAGGKGYKHNFMDADLVQKEGIAGQKRPYGKQIGLKEKDLVGIPWRVAFALQADREPIIENDTDRSWLAALVDGEGTIGIHHWKGGIHGQWPSFQPFVLVTMSDRAVLDRILAITEMGSIKTKAKAGFVDARKIQTTRDCYGWRVEGHDAAKILGEIDEFLIVKRLQARLAYAIYLDQNGKRVGRGHPNPSATIEYRLNLWQTCKLANQHKITTTDLPIPTIIPRLLKDGWWLRSDIIWAKPNPMPESVTDRPTKSHEYVFLLAKSAEYYYDADAIREPQTTVADGRAFGKNGNVDRNDQGRGYGQQNPLGRNKRTVWTINTQPYKGAHFATFPEALVEPMIKAGCPEWVCATCGKARERIVDYEANYEKRESAHVPNNAPTKVDSSGWDWPKREMVGWSDCGHNNYQAGIVLDPFAGSGTVPLVAAKLNRDWVGIELNPEYCEMAWERVAPYATKLRLTS